MPELTDQQEMFLEKRTRMVRSWPMIGGILIAVELGLAGWVLWKNPLLINPQAVATLLSARPLSDSKLVLMASILPFIMLVCLALLAALIVFSFLAISNEKKYIAIIQSFRGSKNAQAK